MLESKRQKKIIDYLHSIGAWTVKVIQGNKAGVPDIIACVPMNKEQILKLFEKQDIVGIFVAPEIKQPKGITSALQKRNIKQINRAGGISSSNITSVEDMKELLSI
jgi:hypothetical protein